MDPCSHEKGPQGMPAGLVPFITRRSAEQAHDSTGGAISGGRQRVAAQGIRSRLSRARDGPSGGGRGVEVDRPTSGQGGARAGRLGQGEGTFKGQGTKGTVGDISDGHPEQGTDLDDHAAGNSRASRELDKIAVGMKVLHGKGSR